jgi:hypothetical protein
VKCFSSPPPGAGAITQQRDTRDVDIQIENGVLTIKGERTAEKEPEEKGYRRIEREYGTFFRSFTLPVNIDVEKAVATFANGLLEVQLPKKEGAKPKTIKVEPKKLLTKTHEARRQFRRRRGGVCCRVFFAKGVRPEVEVTRKGSRLMRQTFSLTPTGGPTPRAPTPARAGAPVPRTARPYVLASRSTGSSEALRVP